MKNTGYKRSLTIRLTKYQNGVAVTGYPKTYRGLDGFICPNPYAVFPDLNPTQFSLLTYSAYITRLNSFKAYIANLEGIDALHADIFTNEEAVYDPVTCR